MRFCWAKIAPAALQKSDFGFVAVDPVAPFVSGRASKREPLASTVGEGLVALSGVIACFCMFNCSSLRRDCRERASNPSLKSHGYLSAYLAFRPICLQSVECPIQGWQTRAVPNSRGERLVCLTACPLESQMGAVISRPTRSRISLYSAVLCASVVALLPACKTLSRPGTISARKGDEMVVAGQFFHTGTPVVLWMDPGGYDAYRVERRFSPFARADWAHSTEDSPELRTPNRYSLRAAGLSAEEIEKVRGGGWDLPLLQRVVDQFVIHFDVCGVSRECFKVLHDHRDLSVHFMLDLDGTIYQTLDLKERAWHATSSNGRSVGIEIANMGDYGSDEANTLKRWYAKDENGRVR